MGKEKTFITLRAMLSPPRLPALEVAFNAGASTGSGRAGTGAAGDKKYGNLNAKPCTLWMHGFFREK
jgi:hypothetical protein